MTTNKLLVDVNIFEDVIRKRKGWEEGRDQKSEVSDQRSEGMGR